MDDYIVGFKRMCIDGNYRRLLCAVGQRLHDSYGMFMTLLLLCEALLSSLKAACCTASKVHSQVVATRFVVSCMLYRHACRLSLETYGRRSISCT